VDDRPAQSLDGFSARFVEISPQFVRAVNLQLLAGRAFIDADGPDAPGVVIVNDTLVRRLWPGNDALGRVLHVKSTLNRDFRIVGVVADVGMGPRHRALESVIYFPLAQLPGSELIFFLRTLGDPRTLTAYAARAIADLDPQITGTKIRPLDDVLAEQMTLQRAGAWLFVALSAFALLLAAAGVYGLLAFVVTRREREIGIRMAMGADRRMIARLVLAQAGALGLVGLTIGSIAAVAAARVLQSVLLQTSASNPAILFVTVLVLSAVIAVASYIPTRRAVRVDPAVSLRAE